MEKGGAIAPLAPLVPTPKYMILSGVWLYLICADSALFIHCLFLCWLWGSAHSSFVYHRSTSDRNRQVNMLVWPDCVLCSLCHTECLVHWHYVTNFKVDNVSHLYVAVLRLYVEVYIMVRHSWSPFRVYIYIRSLTATDRLVNPCILLRDCLRIAYTCLQENILWQIVTVASWFYSHAPDKEVPAWYVNQSASALTHFSSEIYNYTVQVWTLLYKYNAYLKLHMVLRSS